MQLGLARVLTLLASAWVVIEAQESSSTAAPTRPIDPVQLPYCSDWCTVHSTNSAGYPYNGCSPAPYQICSECCGCATHYSQHWPTTWSLAGTCQSSCINTCINVEPVSTTAPTTISPIVAPTGPPTLDPTVSPTVSPTMSPTANPTTATPTNSPTTDPTQQPTASPTLSFQLSPCGVNQISTIQGAANSAQYIVGDSVTIPGFGTTADEHRSCGNRSTAFAGPVAATNASNISFALVIDGASLDSDYEVCIADNSGRTTVTLLPSMRPGTYPATLVARDGNGNAVAIVSWQMNVQQRAPFTLFDPAGTAEAAQLQTNVNSELATQQQFEQGDTLPVPGFRIDGTTDISSYFSHFTRDLAGNPDITLKVYADKLDTPDVVEQTSLGENMFIISSSGKMLLRLDVLGRHNVSLVAESGYGTDAITLLYWTMLVRAGPNGRQCGEHGSPDPADDALSTYGCLCVDGYGGDNCANPLAVALAAGDDGADSITIGASLGGVVFVMLVGLATVRIQLYRLKHRPIDVNGMQEEVLDGLGIRLPKDIADHEFGVTLTFGNDLDPASTESRGLVKFQGQLTVTLSKHLPRLVEELKRARVIVSQTRPNQLLLVVRRPRGYGKQSDVAERTTTTLAKQAARQKLVVGSNTVSSATLALPSRIPRELHRAQLTRIKNLGQGAFGAVDLYQIDETKRGVPPYKAAVKTVKPGAAVGRDQLLKEAALMAMLDHRHVLALVGVVTTPRDLPALIILMYCEGGELLDHVSTVDPIKLTTTKQLTYAAQIALGMQYISTHAIVHRDLAARNVLLDSMGLCKVSDFGMSTSLVQTGKQYAAKYVRLHEEIALRWASPEALQHEKFSTASDVWAYGVTVWEIFARGASEPYDDLGNGEIGPFIRGGGKLAIPSGDVCPAQVYDELMLPCWTAEPADRLDFGELYDICALHGAVEDQITLNERAAKSTVRRRTVLIGDSRYLAPSVHFFQATLLPELNAAVQPSVEANIAGQGDPDLQFPLLDIGKATSYHVKDHIVVPRTHHITCSRDQQKGAIFVDTLSGADDVGPATAILSYAWRYPLRLVSGALDEWCSTEKLDPKRQYVWIDVLCWNQHGRLSDPVAEWTPRVEAIGHQLTMLHPWNKPIYTMRAWCIFELWYAIGLGARCTLGIILAPEDRVAFHDAIRSGGYGVVDEALEYIRAESAEAFSAVDLANIHAKVTSTPGGFDTLNEIVKERLRRWFESQGGIKIATNHSTDGPLEERSNSRSSVTKTSTVRSMPMMQLSDDEQYRGYQDIKVGDRVAVSKYDGAGVVRFVGVVDTQRTHGKSRVGVELDNACGKHNGTVDGHAYFKCAEKHGLLVPLERVTLLAHGEVRSSFPPDTGNYGFGSSGPTTDGGNGDEYLDVQGDSANAHPGVPTRPYGFGFDANVNVPEDDVGEYEI